MINKVERLESERYYIDNFKELNLNKTLLTSKKKGLIQLIEREHCY